MPVDPKEIQEAKEVAREVLALLGDVEKHLKSARNWGFYDMLGGGFFSSWIKHGKIDKAETLLRRVSTKLQRLQKELSDVYIGLGPQVSITGLERFMDIAFDNIISDWMVQSKIQSSLEEVMRVRGEVEQVLYTLDRLEREQGQ
ncbi:MAG: hypothetical protein GX251_08035 [Firmicutes bacterium]|mgnify:CR=1 FL=1|nr:hypothetical protein [Bacillota bacterium]